MNSMSTKSTKNGIGPKQIHPKYVDNTGWVHKGRPGKVF